jgi:hypothetical protein
MNAGLAILTIRKSAVACNRDILPNKLGKCRAGPKKQAFRAKQGRLQKPSLPYLR